jgi:transcriptional regulator of heat shock response
MCGFSVELIDFDQLSDEQTKNLQKNYERKKKALQAQLEEANQSLKGITRALEIIEEKTKAPRAIQSVSALANESAHLT